MPGAFHGLGIATSALRAFQRAIEVTGNNISNANTKGYSRQRIELQSSTPLDFFSTRYSELGTGVSVQSINRAREMFLEARMQSSLGNSGRYSAYADGLRQVEAVYNEPGDSGIANALDQMFNAWSAVASNPSDSASRQQLVNAASLLTSRVRDTYKNLSTLEDQVHQSVTANVESVNNIGARLAQLNGEIRAASVAGGSPNSLLDERDGLVRDLSKLIGVSTTIGSDGTMAVYAGNYPLVLGSDVNNIPNTFDAGSQTFTANGVSFVVRGGEIMGNLSTLQRLASAKSELDTLANTMKTQFNALHSTGTNLLGNTGVNFFKDTVSPTPQTGAIDFEVEAAILANPRAIAAGTSGAAGDGTLALQLSQMKETKFAALGNQTIQGFYGSHVSGISKDITFFSAQLDTASAIVNQIDAQQESISGVNIDDEMTDLLRYQRSYQAAAKVLTIMDQVTEDLINMVRR